MTGTYIADKLICQLSKVQERYNLKHGNLGDRAGIRELGLCQLTRQGSLFNCLSNRLHRDNQRDCVHSETLSYKMVLLIISKDQNFKRSTSIHVRRRQLY